MSEKNNSRYYTGVESINSSINSSKNSNTVSIEKVKEYWNNRPCNIRHSSKDFGTKEYFDEVEARRYFVEPHIFKFAEFERWKGKKVLEIGCGIGTDTINFARFGAFVTAIELSEKSLEIARGRAKVFGLEDKIQFYHGNAEQLSDFLPFSDNENDKFDLIYSCGVIHHTPNPELVIKEMRKFMHKDSELKLLVYHRYSWKVFWILLNYGHFKFWKLKELVAQYSEAQEGSPITYSYTRSEFKKLLEVNGFLINSDNSNNNIWVDYIFPYSISEYIRYEYKRVWYFRYMPDIIFRWLERNFGWHLCVSTRLGNIDFI